MSDFKESNPNDGYEAFRDKFTETFAANQEAGPIFETDLYERYMDGEGKKIWTGWWSSMPESARAHYNCWSCESFFSRFANLVVVNEDGTLSSAFLPELEQTPDLFVESVKWLNNLVKASKITGVYHPTERTVLGTPVSTKGWTHFSAIFAKSDTTFTLKGAAHQYADIASKFITDLREVPEAGWKNVQLLLDAGKFADHSLIDQIKWTLEMKQWFDTNKSTDNFSRLLWVKLAYAPIGWINFKNKSVGELFFNAAKDADGAYMAFLKMTDPLVYQRAQKEATENQIRIAMETVEKLGVGQSLFRRPARVDEIRYLWKPEVVETVTEETLSPEKVPTNPFGVMLDKKEENKAAEPALGETTEVTFSKFWLHILPKAKALRVKPYAISINRYMSTASRIVAHGFMTALHADAPPVFKHDLVEDRYPVNEWAFSEPVDPRVWMDDDKVGQWMDVIGITRSCDEIREPFDFLSEKKQYGFFVVKDMGIVRPTQAALFPELMIPELHSIRAVVENYSVNAGIVHEEKRGTEAAGYSTMVPLLIEVTMDSGKAIYKIVN